MLALAIACDIHPLNNLRVLKYLKDPLGQDDATRDFWYAHWIMAGFAALEVMARPRAGRFLFGDSPTLADVCLVPQMFNARRFNVSLDDYPTLVAADASATTLEAFAAAHPDRAGRLNGRGSWDGSKRWTLCRLQRPPDRSPCRASRAR
jgi:maleylacetoacetate isomerase